MRSKVIVTGLVIHGHHGIFPEERSLGQKFVFDVEASLRSTLAQGDDLGSSARYDFIIDEIASFSQAVRLRTLEALAERTAEHLLTVFEHIEEVLVRVGKPSPPIPQVLERVSVEVSLHRRDVESRGSP